VAAQVLAEQEGLSLAWGRLFLLYGPGEPTARLIPSVVLPLLAGKVARTTVGTQLRDFMYVDDVAGALVEVLDSGIDGPVNVASGQCVELREMIEVAGRATGRPELLAIGALPLRGAEPARLCADVRRLRDEVGFVPRFGLDEGIRETVNWWRGVAEPR
jgi:nucleoside-diphosphate-sugar epimerase